MERVEHTDGVRQLGTQRSGVPAERIERGDPNGEVSIAWGLAQDLCALYQHGSLDAARRDLDHLLTRMISCPIPEVARLGRTLASWWVELLAYWGTSGASNGSTEAMNLLIEKIRHVGHGYRNFDNYRLRLLLHCGITARCAHHTDQRTPSQVHGVEPLYL